MRSRRAPMVHVTTESFAFKKFFRPREALLLASNVAISVVLSSALTLAWTGPTSAPPNGNADAPINVGTAAQFKNGDIGLWGNLLLAANGGSGLPHIAIPGSKLEAGRGWPAFGLAEAE